MKRPASVAAVVALTLLSGAVGAQAPAPAGGAPTARVPGDRSGLVRGVALNGVTVDFAGELDPVVLDLIGKPVSLAALQQAAERITQIYRDRGYFLAQAVVPEQEIRDGQVTITVLEGRIGEVRLSLAPELPVAAERVQVIVAGLPRDRPLHVDSYERVMLLLADTPGLRVQSGLEPGRTAGTTDVVIEVTPAESRWRAAIEADNHGTKASGRYRIGPSVRWFSPFGIGDNLDARLMLSSGNGQTLGRIAYEAPLDGDGWRAGAAVSRVAYDLGGAFSELGATGTADVLDVSLAYPLLRTRQRNLFSRLSLEQKRLTDELEIIDLSTNKRSTNVIAALNWEVRDSHFGGGYLALGSAVTWGRLDLRSDALRQADTDQFGLRTGGHYFKLNLSASRLQSILPRHNLFVGLSGQASSRNLDASEKFALGGARGVRAYPSGEVLADAGWLATVEWRYAFTDDLALALLYDAGGGRFNRFALPNAGSNYRMLRGTGLGASYSGPWGITASASVAWRLSDAAVSDGSDRTPRIFVQLQKSL